MVMDRIEDVVVLIPSLNPDSRLIKLVKSLTERGFASVVIVDDGSDGEHRQFFDEIRNHSWKNSEVFIYRHFINMGKGRALKDGFNYILCEFENVKGVVTADSDGQHSVDDILKCAELLINEPEDSKTMILGCRNFDGKNVPLRSSFGNKVTRRVLSALCGVRTTDTQTGLRGFTRKTLEEFLCLGGERFEYETNMLIECPQRLVTIKEYPISTIYIEDEGKVNSTSHFNPIVDSVKIYLLFIKFLASSLSTSLIDMILFVILNFFFKDVFPLSYIIIDTFLARIVSALYNYTINRNKVFRSTSNVRSSLFKYILLCIVQALLSSILVTFITEYLIHSAIISKIIIDSLLFCISFYVQREFVFKMPKGDSSK